MWDILAELLKLHGVFALFSGLELVALIYLYKQGQKKQEQLVALYQERVKDVTESKERYEELAHKLDDSIDLLIKVFKRTI
jgi:hypothetical protein